MGNPKKMHLPSTQDMARCIRQTGKGAFLYCCDVPYVYCQLPLDPADWPLVCFAVDRRYYTDVSLPFSLCWAAASCQDVTDLMARHIGKQGIQVLNYIDDFGWVGGHLQNCGY